MTIISSQHFIDWEIVESKMESLKDAKSVIIPCWSIGEIDGEEYAIMYDGHHTITAARELGLEIDFDIEEEPEGLTGETAMEARWIDGDWYNVEESNPAYEEYTLVW